VLAFIPFPSWLKPEIIPGLPIRWYGLMYLLAFATTYLMVKLQIREKRLEVPSDDVLNLFFWAIIGLLVGARLFSVLIYDPGGYYLRHPLQILLPVSFSGGRLRFTGLQGMSYHGGLLGAVTAAVVYLRRKRLDVLDWGDMMVTGASLGYTFGRLGNFINGELYGRITRVGWGMVFPLAERFPAQEAWVREFSADIGLQIAGAESVNLPRHPSQLYEAFFEGLVLWLILWFVLRRRRAFKGQLLASYVIGYGLVRFFIEYLRQPDVELGFPIQLVALENPQIQFSFFNFTAGQILNFLMIAGGVLCLLLFRNLERRRRAAVPERSAHSPRKLRKKIR
jgi:phosphatidylglycerol:prolipoprotein diacylglycerol transferase